jgi:Transglycosylase-like domain/Putative peptidoglycan binding domain
VPTTEPVLPAAAPPTRDAASAPSPPAARGTADPRPYFASRRQSRLRRAEAARSRRFRLRRRGGAVALVAIMAVAGGAAPAQETGGVEAGVGVLERGGTGPGVTALQQRLGIAADGVFGPQTARAVRRFQRAHGLAADGVVGPATAAALGLARASLHQDTRSTVRLPAELRRIARCESGGNPWAISPGGRHRGKYQFTRKTWRAMGGKGDPAQAPEAEQDRRALRLYRAQGTSPWPACA